MAKFLALAGTTSQTYKIGLATFTATGLTAARNFTLPDIGGTLALLGGVQTFTGIKTFTDDIFITTASSSGGLVIDSPAGSMSEVWMRSGTALRWSIRKNNTAEAGSNVGGDLDVNRYDDAGTIIARALRVTRSTGVFDFTVMPTVGGAALMSWGTAPTYKNSGSGFNLNSLNIGEKVTVATSLTNSPTYTGVTYWLVECHSTYLADNNSRCQRAYAWDKPVMAMRTLQSGSWSAWAYVDATNIPLLNAANTFSADQVVAHAGAVLLDVRSTDDTAAQLRLISNSPTNRRFLGQSATGVTESQMNFGTGEVHFWGASTTNKLLHISATAVDPDDDNVKTLGAAAKRWSAVYMATPSAGDNSDKGATTAFVATANAALPGYAHGTSFPGSPATNDKFFRDDLGLQCFYDGTRWLTAHEYSQTMAPSGLLQPSSTVGTMAIRTSLRDDFGIYLTKFAISTYVTAPNSGTAYYSHDLTWVSASNVGTSLGVSFTTAADTGSTWTLRTLTINAVLSSSAKSIQLVPTKTGSPGNTHFIGTLYYRLIIT